MNVDFIAYSFFSNINTTKLFALKVSNYLNRVAMQPGKPGKVREFDI